MKESNLGVAASAGECRRGQRVLNVSVCNCFGNAGDDNNDHDDNGHLYSIKNKAIMYQCQSVKYDGNNEVDGSYDYSFRVRQTTDLDASHSNRFV